MEWLGLPAGYEKSTTRSIWEFLQITYLKTDKVYITDAGKIKRRLTEWQYLHYNQAHDTHFASKKWYDCLNPNAIDNNEILEILHGKYNQDTAKHYASKAVLKKIS